MFTIVLINHCMYIQEIDFIGFIYFVEKADGKRQDADKTIVHTTVSNVVDDENGWHDDNIRQLLPIHLFYSDKQNCVQR